MTYYLISETLKECRPEEIQNSEYPFVAVLTPEHQKRYAGGQTVRMYGCDHGPCPSGVHPPYSRRQPVL